MQIGTIQCQTCMETLGTLVKQEITADDQAIYNQSCTCDNGHQNVQIVNIQDED